MMQFVFLPLILRNKLTTQIPTHEGSLPIKAKEDWKVSAVDPFMDQMRVLPKLT